MPDKHLPYSYPSPAHLRLMMGSFLCAQTERSIAAMQPNGLDRRNWGDDYTGLGVYWGAGVQPN